MNLQSRLIQFLVCWNRLKKCNCHFLLLHIHKLSMNQTNRLKVTQNRWYLRGKIVVSLKDKHFFFTFLKSTKKCRFFIEEVFQQQSILAYLVWVWMSTNVSVICEDVWTNKKVHETLWLWVFFQLGIRIDYLRRVKTKYEWF